MENAKNVETFKPIPGYPGYYISNLGRVWRVTTRHYLQPSEKENGYYQVNMFAANGKRKKEYIHRLVALAFLPNPDGLPEVDHIDRDRSNNNLENLRWVSRSENQRNKNNKIKIVDRYGKETLCESVTDAAEFCGCNRSSIYDWLSGRCQSKEGYIISRI